MIRLENSVDFQAYRLKHPIMESKLQFASTIKLTDIEINCMDMAMHLMEQALIRDNMAHLDIRAAVYFTDDGSLSLSFAGDQYMGMFQRVIIFPVGRWRRKNLSVGNIITVMLEELCHCFYQVTDEDLVKDLVTSITQFLAPGCTRRQLYGIFEDPQDQA